MKSIKSAKTKLQQKKSVIESLPVKLIDEIDIHTGGFIAGRNLFSTQGLDPAYVGRHENFHCTRGRSRNPLKLELVVSEPV